MVAVVLLRGAPGSKLEICGAVAGTSGCNHAESALHSSSVACLQTVHTCFQMTLRTDPAWRVEFGGYRRSPPGQRGSR